MGPTTTIESPQRISVLVTWGRADSSGVAETSMAPTVKNGETSTMEAQTAMAQIMAHPGMPPAPTRGMARGRAPRACRWSMQRQKTSPAMK